MQYVVELKKVSLSECNNKIKELKQSLSIRNTSYAKLAIEAAKHNKSFQLFSNSSIVSTINFNCSFNPFFIKCNFETVEYIALLLTQIILHNKESNRKITLKLILHVKEKEIFDNDLLEVYCYYER